ncbi:MAG: IS21 family transposase [Bryobacterales bacterium]|nr:IS21 family transposase [Bryobacterales bacterium]
MPRARIAMDSIQEILRLHHECGCSQREIARSCGLAAGTVNRLLQQAGQAGLEWPLPPDWDEAELHRRLYGGPSGARPSARRQTLDFAAVHKQLSRRKHLTVQLVWQEYREQHPDGYSYSQFCELYRDWKTRQDLVMLQEHKAGDRIFVDYAGATVPVYELAGAEPRAAHIFVATLGASSFFYAEANWGQDIESWVSAHVHTLEDFGGAANVWVPDNLKSGVTRACRYEPVLNRSYRDMARHYGMAIVPARPYRPKDKAKVEKCVQLVEQQLLEALRHERFTSLGELNAAIAARRKELNARPFQKRPESRRELFEQVDRPALRPLPAQRYEFAAWQLARVNIDYHVAVDGHRYSVPCDLVREEVEVRLTTQCVEVLHQGRRVAAHARSRTRGGFTTEPGHRPKSHREHGQWPPERMRQWAATVGPSTARLVQELLERSPFPQERYGSCLGIIRLAQQCGQERMEAAARRALHYRTVSYASIKAILASRAEQQPLEGEPSRDEPVEHANIRGGEYYEQESASGPEEEPTC